MSHRKSIRALGSWWSQGIELVLSLHFSYGCCHPPCLVLGSAVTQSLPLRLQMVRSVNELQLFTVFFSFGSAASKWSRDYWQSKPPSACVGQPAPLNPSKHFSPEIGSGCILHVCVHVQQGATNSHTRAHTRTHTHTHTHIYTHTHRHTHNTEGIWAARQLRGIEARSICTGVTQMTINNTVLMTVAVATAHHVSSLVGFPPLRTCIILEGKHSSVFALIIHTFP